MGMRTTLKGMAVICVLSAPQVALAQTELKNDGFQDNDPVYFQAGFVSGEIGASKFIVPEPGMQVTAVRFLFGGAGGQEDITLRIYDNPGNGDAPGTQVFTGKYTLTAADDAFQEIDLSSEDLFVPGNFRVGIEFTHSGLPSIGRDDNGLIPGRNYIRASGGVGWVDSADFFLDGDWIIRADVVGGGGGQDAGPLPDGGGGGSSDAGADGGPEVDAGIDVDGGAGGCAGNPDCDEGEYCNVSAGVCTCDCREDDDCATGNTCNSLGMCVAADDGGGCGCASSAASGSGGGGGRGGWIFLAAAVGWMVRPRPRQRRR
jgi:hypothetical protein